MKYISKNFHRSLRHRSTKIVEISLLFKNYDVKDVSYLWKIIEMASSIEYKVTENKQMFTDLNSHRLPTVNSVTVS